MNESALKERLKAVAIEKKTTLNKVWKQLLLERFLSRLSSSRYHDKFIFKGGLLLAQYADINRETIDIDFLMTKMKGEVLRIEESIKEIAEIDTKDGFYFTWFSIEKLNQPHMEYEGFRTTLNVKFSKMQDKIHVDIAIGDIVEPIEVIFSPFQYKGMPIFEGEISLLVYPPEAIFSEKLETIISKGSINSRMKDYHDLFIMIREPRLLNSKKLAKTIKLTFDNRGTPLSVIQFDEGRIDSLQDMWGKHLRGLGGFRSTLNFPDQITEVIDEINHGLFAKEIGVKP